MEKQRIKLLETNRIYLKNGKAQKIKINHFFHDCILPRKFFLGSFFGVFLRNRKIYRILFFPLGSPNKIN